jgi:RimJ/RimL family protein N-acetyltransferase
LRVTLILITPHHCERKAKEIGFSDMTGTIAQEIRETPGTARQAPGTALPGEFVLRDGTPALIWPLLPTDAETLRDMFRRLSPESRRHRFLQVLDELDEPMIRRLVDSVDGVQHIALLLIVLPADGPEEPVGVARLLQHSDDPAAADVAATVVDEWQRRGAGAALASALMERRPAAVTRLHTVVEADNHGSLALLSQLGQMSSDLPNLGVREVTVELPRVNRDRTVAETVAWLWAQAAQKLISETPLAFWRRSASLVPTMTGCVEFAQRMAEINRELTLKWASAPFAVPSPTSPPTKPPAGTDASP